MKKEELNELRKIFEKNSKKASENKEKEKTKDNEKGEKEKSGSVYEKNKFNDNIRDKNNVNKSVYINSSNIDKMKNIFNNQNKNKEKGNELEIIRKSLAPVKEKKENKKEEKKIELRKSEKIEFKKAESSELQKNNLKDMPNIFSNVESKIKRAETNQNKKVIKPQDHYKNEQNIPIGNEINNENKKIKENNNVNFKDKISMFNNFIEKNKKNETGTQDFYSRVKTHSSSDNKNSKNFGAGYIKNIILYLKFKNQKILLITNQKENKLFLKNIWKLKIENNLIIKLKEIETQLKKIDQSK